MCDGKKHRCGLDRFEGENSRWQTQTHNRHTSESIAGSAKRSESSPKRVSERHLIVIVADIPDIHATSVTNTPPQTAACRDSITRG
ncbi:hypothetical protein RRSWK_07184 [Rhodopirellula sp. SWK7]|nr:hypothetical protein RRSWK_07184 [Rhodopirellula sp. SWK7]